MKIKEATIHEIIKSANTNGPKSVTYKPRETALPVSPLLEAVAYKLMTAYSKNVSGYGSLDDDPVTHQFPQILETYTEQANDANSEFIKFTLDTLHLIGNEMSKVYFATGSYVMFFRYDNMGSDWLLVAMLKLSKEAGLDPNTMDLEELQTLDVSHLSEAARVNITGWSKSDPSYLSFIKKTNRGEKVSDYFRNALSCLDYTASKQHTVSVIDALKDFTNSSPDISDNKRRETWLDARKSFYDYCDSSKDEVVLDTISAYVLPSNPNAFKDFVRAPENSEKYKINERFKPDRQTYSQLRRIRSKMGTVTLSFDVSDLNAKRVTFNEIDNTVVLTSPSTELIRQIKDNVSQSPTNSGP